MKAVVLILFSMSSTFAQYRRSNPYEAVVDTSVKYQQAPDSLAQTVVRRPEYKVETYDTVVSSKLVCCVTKNDENDQAPISQNDPVQPLEDPTENDQLEQNSRDVIIENLANVFQRVLSETILKAIRSLLNAFEEPRASLKTDHDQAPEANSYMLSDSTNQLKYFLQRLNSKPILGIFGFEHPWFQSNQQKNYDCEYVCAVVPSAQKIMPVGKCWNRK